MIVKTFFSKKLPADPLERFAALERAGYSPVYTVWQEHGTDAAVLRAPFVCPSPAELTANQPRADIIVTNQPGLWIGVKTADCVPVLLRDESAGVVAAVHAGWRGTALGIVKIAADIMAREFGASPANMRAAMGPCICKACFETRGDVPAALPPGFSEHITDDGDGRFHVDLPGINAAMLKSVGVTDIAMPPACTCCDPETYWSHRKHGNDRGLQVSLVQLTVYS